MTMKPLPEEGGRGRTQSLESLLSTVSLPAGLATAKPRNSELDQAQEHAALLNMYEKDLRTQRFFRIFGLNIEIVTDKKTRAQVIGKVGTRLVLRLDNPSGDLPSHMLLAGAVFIKPEDKQLLSPQQEMEIAGGLFKVSRGPLVGTNDNGIPAVIEPEHVTEGASLCYLPAAESIDDIPLGVMNVANAAGEGLPTSVITYEGLERIKRLIVLTSFPLLSHPIQDIYRITPNDMRLPLLAPREQERMT